ncbi:hypothetical protein RHDC4_00952 [Rhodocyclaceae bacterium]|nr:hypothetical protein RHDC4_00952 [Rhodocyclaceae bacterium]
MSNKRLAIGLSAAVLAAAFALPAAARTFCCTDKSGRKICGDILPEQCEDRAYKEFGDKGKIRNVEAPLTPEQKAQREAEEARKKEAERMAAEQRRKDQALLNTYTGEKEIDIARDRAIADHEALAKQAREKYERAAKRRQQLDKELEFYAKKPVPPDLKAQIKEAETEIVAQQKLMDDKKKDVEATRAKFEDDKKRYRELTTKPAGR